jgi:hypothetical protein
MQKHNCHSREPCLPAGWSGNLQNKKIPHQVQKDIEKIVNQTKPLILSATKNFQ